MALGGVFSSMNGMLIAYMPLILQRLLASSSRCSGAADCISGLAYRLAVPRRRFWRSSTSYYCLPASFFSALRSTALLCAWQLCRNTSANISLRTLRLPSLRSCQLHLPKGYVHATFSSLSAFPPCSSAPPCSCSLSQRLSAQPISNRSPSPSASRSGLPYRLLRFVLQ